jgi:hypothetical protein
MAYIDVPAEAIRAALTSAGFRLMDREGGSIYNEEVWFRAHAGDAKFAVKVYSSVKRGATGARACGSDAIRVVAIRHDPTSKDPRFEGTWKGLWKAKRVFRTGTVDGVIARMLERMREAYAACILARRGLLIGGLPIEQLEQLKKQSTKKEAS